MTAYSSMKTEVMQRVNDPSGNTITAAIAGRAINEALEDWTNTVEPKWRHYGWFVTAKQWRYTLPSDWVKPKTMMWYQAGANAEIPYYSPKEFQRRGLLAFAATTSTPMGYTIIDDEELWLGPAPGTTSNSSLMAGSLSSSATTITVADGTKFHNHGGWILLESEQIQHQGISTNDLTLCKRAQGGTTAASHTCVTAYRLDLVADYFYVPAALSSDNDAPSLNQRWHKGLLYKAMADCLFILGREEEAATQLKIYESKKMEAKREVRRLQRDQYMQVYSPYE